MNVATFGPVLRSLGRRGLVVASLVAAVASLISTPSAAGAQEDVAGGLREIGRLPRPNDVFKRPMVVDEARSLGFATTSGGAAHLHLLDLERLVSLGSESEAGFDHGFTPESRLALDPKRQRLYATLGYPDPVAVGFSPTCSTAPDLRVFDYRPASSGRRTIRQDFIAPLPCTGQSQFYGLTNFYDADNDLLYMGGVSAADTWRWGPSIITPLPSLLGGTFEEDRGQPLLLRQMRSDKDGLRNAEPTAPRQRFILDWEVDLRVAGCGRRQQVNVTLFEGFVTRLGNEVLAYCWDARPYRGLQAGQQGYIVRIPLVSHPDGVMRPQTRGEPVVDPTNGQITNYVSRRTPTLPGDVTPILDRVSGRLMLVTTGAANGNAVWVYDPKAERFVGVITGGYGDEPVGNTAVGFDSRKGRVYVLTQHGLLIAPIRLDPLPAGIVYPVLVNKDRKPNFVSSYRISAAPELGRLFVGINDNNGDADDHYAVLEDNVPDPPTIEPVDPDTLTADIKEEDGKTASATSGRALASGAHIVNTGGLPRVIGQNDPTCVVDPPNTQAKQAGASQDDIPDWELAPALFGSCLPDMVASPGHREAAAAATELETSTGGGALARGSAFEFGSNDTGTDGDIRRLSDCGGDSPDRVDRWGRRWPFPDNASVTGNATSQEQGANPVLSRSGGPPDGQGNRQGDKRPFENQYNAGRDAFWNSWSGPRESGQKDYRAGCNEFQDGVASNGGPDLRAGTKGTDGKGFPIRSAVCGDFGGNPSAESWPDGSSGQPQAAYPTSSARCDAAGPTAEGRASAGVLAVPSAADPQLSVGRVSTYVTGSRTPEGQVTVAYATATGVQLASPEGTLSIAEVRSLAVTKAAGRRGSTSALLVRQLCGISVTTPEDQADQPGCVDASSPDVDALLDEVSATLLQKVQLSVPEGFTQATPKGYQAVVTKSPGQRGADQTVNDDDSHTVSALQAVIYNDGPKGRSRLVVQLAGVHAESRYGVIELPNFDFGGFEPEPEPAPEPELPAPPDVGGDPGSTPAPVPTDSFTPESFIEEDLGVGADEFVRFSAPPPRTVTVPGPRGNPLERVVRVPVRVLSDAINLLVQNPREAALLFVTWALLAAPLYLGLRRRSFARALTA